MFSFSCYVTAFSDVEGFDACRKIAILASMAFGAQVEYEEVHTEGITKITDVDMKYANALGMSIKLFGTCKKQDGDIFAMVSPVLVGEQNPLYTVNDVMNGISSIMSLKSAVMASVPYARSEISTQRDLRYSLVRVHLMRRFPITSICMICLLFPKQAT